MEGLGVVLLMVLAFVSLKTEVVGKHSVNLGKFLSFYSFVCLLVTHIYFSFWDESKYRDYTLAS